MTTYDICAACTSWVNTQLPQKTGFHHLATACARWRAYQMQRYNPPNLWGRATCQAKFNLISRWLICRLIGWILPDRMMGKYGRTICHSARARAGERSHGQRREEENLHGRCCFCFQERSAVRNCNLSVYNLLITCNVALSSRICDLKVNEMSTVSLKAIKVLKNSQVKVWYS